MAEAKLIDLGGGEVVVVELEEVREMVRRQWGAEGVECSRVRWVATGEGYVLWGGPGNVHGDEEWEAFGLIAVGGRTPAESAREKGTTCGAGVLKWVCATQLRKGWRICEWDEGAAYVASGPTAVVGVVHVGTASVAAAVLLRAGGEETPGWETKLYCFGPQKHFRVLAVDGFGAKGLGPGAEQRLQCLVALDEDFAMTTVRTPEGGAPGSERSGANALLLPPAKLAQRTTQALVVGAGNGASTSTPDLILATREGEVACVRGGVILWKASLGVEGSKFSRIVRLAPGGLVIFAEFLEKSRMGSIRSFKGFGLGSQSCSVVPSASERVEIIPQSPKSLGSGVVALCPRRAAGGQPGVTPLSFKGKDALASTLSVMRWEAAEAPSPHQDENESESENGNAQDLLSETIRSRLVEELDGLLEQDRQRLDMGAMLMDSKARLNDWAHKAMCGAFKQEGRLPKALKRFDLGTSLKSSILVTALEGKYVADSFVVCAGCA
ncbi:hypothetical protein A3770_12p67480 [Chloropicon primus]|uniref:Uncharacterized protein n=2 Tax=Chloropicon primus TaxID=1764295 RepID=A0A5B8MXM2_9CHLO|nr:hypothetical protein A3770_12p67480 [Chloropicon primus]|eukprot:QDZ24230.1 hypothetical protein A3770_12p67480 [Chloropicon primus]